MARKKKAVMSEAQYRNLHHQHAAGSPKKLSDLRKMYRSAKDHRNDAGKAWAKNKSQGNYFAYRAAEAEWQAVGQKLGQISGTHKKRRVWHRGTTQNVTQIFKGTFKTVSRRKKNTKTARRR